MASLVKSLSVKGFGIVNDRTDTYLILNVQQKLIKSFFFYFARKRTITCSLCESGTCRDAPWHGVDAVASLGTTFCCVTQLMHLQHMSGQVSKQEATDPDTLVIVPVAACCLMI